MVKAVSGPRYRFIVGTALSQLGTWVNIAAVMIVVQEREGAIAVALYFLLRTATPLLGSRALVLLVPAHRVGQAWAVAQIGLAVLMALAALLSAWTAAILVVTAIAAVLQSSAGSWSMHLVATLVPSSQRAETLTALATCGSVALVAGPALGGILFALNGLSLVFFCDAVSFVLAVLLTPWRRAGIDEQASVPLQPSRRRLRRSFSVPSVFPNTSSARILIAAWVLFGLFGGVLTAVEMPIMTGLQGLSAGEIGSALACFGAGGLVVFLLASFCHLSPRSLLSAAILVGAVALWLVSTGWLIYGAFFLAGLGYSMCASALRVHLLALSDADPNQSADLWSWVVQLALITSVVAAGLAGLCAVSAPGPAASIAVLLVLGVALVVSTIRHRYRDRDGPR